MTTTTKPPTRSPVTIPPPAGPPASLDLGDLLARLFGDQPAGLLRVTAGDDNADDSEKFFRRTREGWSWPRARGTDTPLDFLARNCDTPCGWSPLLFAAPATSGPVTVPVLWAVWHRVVVPHLALPSYGAVDPMSEAETVGKVAALSPLPSVVLDDGRRLIALWRLTTPLASTTIAENRLLRLAVAFGASREAALLARSVTFPVPGTLAAGIIPAHKVVAVALGAETVSLDALEANS